MAAPPRRRTPTEAPMAVSQPVELKKLRKPSFESLSDLFPDDLVDEDDEDVLEECCDVSAARMEVVESAR